METKEEVKLWELLIVLFCTAATCLVIWKAGYNEARKQCINDFEAIYLHSRNHNFKCLK